MAVQVVSFHCVLKNKLGKVISSTFNHNVLTQSQSETDYLKDLGPALEDLKKGEKRKICLKAEQAYGFYNPALVLTRQLAQLDLEEPLRLGEKIVYVSGGKKGVYRVTELKGDTVTLDGNHPLAGQDLIFEIETVAAREATKEELAQAKHAKQSVPAHSLKYSYELGVA